MGKRKIAGVTRAAVLLVWTATLAASHPAAGERLHALVHNQRGEQVSDAVVYAFQLDPEGNHAPPSQPVVIDQIDKEYVPYVTAVPVGTRIQFPNHDQIRHHVYSFSEAKTFEIPLYRGVPADPIVFDKPGAVVLGCNIHDWMRAYVYVTETPYYAVTGDGGDATLVVPPGEYAVRVWHPELERDTQAPVQRVSLKQEAPPAEVRFTIEQHHVWRPRRAPSLVGTGYR